LIICHLAALRRLGLFNRHADYLSDPSSNLRRSFKKVCASFPIL
jgi:hypothetical protein